MSKNSRILGEYPFLVATLMRSLINIKHAMPDKRYLNKNEKLPDKLNASLENVIEGFHKVSSVLNLDTTMVLTERMREAQKLGYSYSDLLNDLTDLESRFCDQLQSRNFLFVDSSLSIYYRKNDLFGHDVNNKFPEAIDDIEDAGSCLALSQGTACVMHLMRVLEAGLKLLAKSLDIPYAPSWESYLLQIDKKISDKHKSKIEKWKESEKFYRDISGDLICIKTALRNPTMHVDRKYSPEEAEVIYNAIKYLMQHMALNIKS